MGGRQTEAFCKTLKQRELKALGCRWDAVGKVYVAPSDTTFQRVMAHTDPASLERVAQRWAQPRVERPRALAADGKRIRGANRLTAEGLHWETVTLVDHATGVPVASRSYREEGGEQWAMRAILEETDVRDVTPLDAGHAGFDLERALVEQHGADYVLRIKGNCKRTRDPDGHRLGWQARSGRTPSSAGSAHTRGAGSGPMARCSRRLRNCCHSGTHDRPSASRTRAAGSWAAR